MDTCKVLTCGSKLDATRFHQKYTPHVVFNEDQLTTSHPILQSLIALSVYQVNFCHQLTVVCKMNKNQTSLIFNKLIKKIYSYVL